MFEDKTYENIMAQMMEEMPEGVATEEGSLIWNACSKQAMMLEEAYLAMQGVEDNMYADTQDEEHLILNGADKGIPFKGATHAVVKGVFQQPIQTGTLFTSNDLNYMVLELMQGYEYRLKCEESGSIGNIAGGELSPIDFVDNYLGGTIAEILIPGEEQEDLEAYREKILALNDSYYFGGNRADYVRHIERIQGVGAVKVRRRIEGDEYIYPVIISAEYAVPSDALVDTVQAAVDPEQNHGNGDGIAPIGHYVKILPASGILIDINTEFVFDDGYSQEALQSYITQAVDSYFMELKREWKTSEQLIVRIAQIETRMLQITGVIDIGGTTLNGVGANVVLNYSEIPVRGSINGV